MMREFKRNNNHNNDDKRMIVILQKRHPVCIQQNIKRNLIGQERNGRLHTYMKPKLDTMV